MKDDIVIVSAARTPVGAFNGVFANLPAHELGKAAIKAALRAGIEGAQVSRSRGRSIGRAGPESGPQDHHAGIRWRRPGEIGSAARAAHCASAISHPQRRSEVVRAARIHDMAPHCAHLRNGVKMGNFTVDTMIRWPVDAFNGYHMGNTAENAQKYQITRQQQDEFAVASPGRGPEGGKLRTITGDGQARKGDVVVIRTNIRAGTTRIRSASSARLHKDGTARPPTRRASTTVLPPWC